MLTLPTLIKPFFSKFAGFIRFIKLLPTVIKVAGYIRPFDQFGVFIEVLPRRLGNAILTQPARNIRLLNFNKNFVRYERVECCIAVALRAVGDLSFHVKPQDVLFIFSKSPKTLLNAAILNHADELVVGPYAQHFGRRNYNAKGAEKQCQPGKRAVFLCCLRQCEVFEQFGVPKNQDATGDGEYYRVPYLCLQEIQKSFNKTVQSGLHQTRQRSSIIEVQP